MCSGSKNNGTDSRCIAIDMICSIRINHAFQKPRIAASRKSSFRIKQLFNQGQLSISFPLVIFLPQNPLLVCLFFWIIFHLSSFPPVHNFMLLISLTFADNFLLYWARNWIGCFLLNHFVWRLEGMGKNDIYELIDLKGNAHPDVCGKNFWKVDSCVCNQEIDIRDVIKYVDPSNKDCLDALQDLSIALSTGISLSYTILLC